MAFTQAAGNFRQAWSAETTLAFLRRLTLAARMNGTWDGDAMTDEVVYVQNPNYNVQATTPARKADWGTPNEPSASRISIMMNQTGRVENMLYVEDEVENAVRTYRARLQRVSINMLGRQYEDNIVAYMNALATTGNASQNGNAGPIEVINFPGDNNTGFRPVTVPNGASAATKALRPGQPNGNSAQQATAREWIEDFLTIARVELQRNDVYDGETVGGGRGNFWCALPVELYAFGLAAALEAKGLSLEFTTQVIQNIGVFGNAFGGSFKGFDIFVTNSLPRAATHDNAWVAYVGTDQAVAAPRRPLRNYVREPANAVGERFEFRHAHTFGRQLVNSKLLIKGTFNAADGVAP